MVDKVADKRGTRGGAGLPRVPCTPRPGRISPRGTFRPRDDAVAARYAAQFPPVRTFDVDAVFGGWRRPMQNIFADGGVFDSL